MPILGCDVVVCDPSGRQQWANDGFDREPGVAAVEIRRAVGSPAGQVEEDAARLERVVPGEGVAVDGVGAVRAVGGEEAAGDSSGCSVDDRPQRSGCLQGWVRKQADAINAGVRCCASARFVVRRRADSRQSAGIAAASLEPVTYSFQRCSAMRVRVAHTATLAFARLAHVRWP